MRVIAVDPGSEQSGFIVLDTGLIVAHGIEPNDAILAFLRNNSYRGDVLVYESIASYGMPVGREVFATVKFCGRCEEAWHPKPAHPLERRHVKAHLCYSPRATDANIRQAIIDRYGGSKDAAIGKKATPGPLYSVKGHEFAALAVGLTWLDTHPYP